MKRTRGTGWIVSPVFDILFFIGPSLLALTLVAFCPKIRAAGAETSMVAWVMCVLLVDVAHVWSSLYRTYLDPEELAGKPELYGVVPLSCAGVGVFLYALDPRFFWRALAYLAVLHFIRQQYGFAALYGRSGAWIDRHDARIDKAAIYAATLYPLIYWHTHMPRPFVWFVPGDFVGVDCPWLSGVAAVLWAGSLAIFVARQIWLYVRHKVFFPGRFLLVMTTALVWYIGIVACAADFAFTVTNCLAHGLPYLALVWWTHHRRWRAPQSRNRLVSWLAHPAALPLFFGLVAGLAWIEEALWDNLVWHDRAAVFGMWLRAWSPAPESAVLAILVPLLALPQATHYILDGFIWKMDGSNPRLAEELFPDLPPGPLLRNM